MPSHPRVEEVEDSDVDMSDPSEGDIDDFADSEILRRVQVPPSTTTTTTTSSSSSHRADAGPRQHSLNPPLGSTPAPASDASQYADFQCLYPVYFDASRTRAAGRRVAKALAVSDPLATEIMNACRALGLPTVLEPTKQHPQDWANPGRVRVGLKRAAATRRRGAGGGTDVRNKHHLYTMVAAHLQAHPTAEDSASLRFRIPGVPPPPALEPGKPWPKPAVPRGWTMGRLLPYYSPAMTGGGVSENLFKDMMKEMQGGGGDMASMLSGAGPSAAAAGGPTAGGEEKKRKERKGKGKG
ncbi:hypothetical protein P8C59_005428 [Phyllachora maydis]|uniref:Signal recognition particle protein n=1 Tax=Phyllachora maydis TaxID=1825666 RepID=A0AAD9I5K1_9PEZI|nr:hypothetical protein P8C59_005428 [Phyllachora maydis]